MRHPTVVADHRLRHFASTRDGTRRVECTGFCARSCRSGHVFASDAVISFPYYRRLRPGVTVRVAFAVGFALLLQGCASSATFSKPNTALSVAERDAEQCWQQAQRTSVPEQKASENLTGAFIVGGLVGVGINRAANEDDYRGRLRDQCMAKRGYARSG